MSERGPRLHLCLSASDLDALESLRGRLHLDRTADAAKVALREGLEALRELNANASTTSGPQPAA